MKNSWNPIDYDKHARFVSDLALDLIDLLELRGEERVLDVGCGDGVLSLEVQKRCKSLLGIDASSQMVRKALQNGINAKVLDVCEMDFEDEFERVFSNAALHWVKDHKIALTNISNSLKAGGIFVAELGGAGNVDTIIKAMREVFRIKNYQKFENPWFFPSLSEYVKLLENANLQTLYIELIPRFTPIDDMKNWLKLFANGIVSHLSANQKEEFVRLATERLTRTPLYNNGKWYVDYVRLRFKAIKIK